MRRSPISMAVVSLIAAVSTLSCSAGTKPPYTSNNAPSPSQPTSIINLRGLMPIAGIPLQRFKDNDGKSELDKRAQEDVNKRATEIRPKISAWASKMEEVTGTKISEDFVRGGSLDFVLALVEGSPIRGDGTTPAQFLILLTERMSVLYDGAKLRRDVSDKLLKRLASIKPAQLQQWKAEFDKVLGGEINKVYIAPIIIPVDRFFESDQYSGVRANQYFQRLGTLSKESVKRWTIEVDQYKGTELDAAMNIILIDEFFENDRFSANMYDAMLNAQK